MTELAIEAQGLRKSYRSVPALAGMDLTVPAGTVLGLLGPNGAGKTTCVRILATLLRPDAGTARIAGFDVVRQAAEVRARIGLTGQYAAVDGFATGRENLVQAGLLHGLGRKVSAARAGELLETFSLAPLADRRADTYSGGERRRLDIATSLIGRPPVLFLDEPTTGLDPRARLGAWDIIRGLAHQGTAVLLTTQYLDEADSLAQRVTVINRGATVAEGTPAELKARLGGERLRLRPTDPSHGARLAAAVTEVADSPPQVDDETGEVSIAVENDPMVVADVLQSLKPAGVPLADITLARPTLDDVFLSLTGHDPGDAAKDGR